MYGDKETTLARFKENYTSKLTDEMKARLVLENDEVSLTCLSEARQTFLIMVPNQICYNVDDLLPVCNELDIPIVVSTYPSSVGPNLIDTK